VNYSGGDKSTSDFNLNNRINTSTMCHVKYAGFCGALHALFVTK